MTSSDRVRAICKERKIAISRLEKDCGFGNAYIRELKGELPADRCLKVANYLGVSIEYLLNGVETKKAPVNDGREQNEDRMKMHKYADVLSDDIIEQIVKYADFLTESKK